MAKIGTFMIGMILVSLFTGVFAIAISSGVSEYGVTFDNDSITSYNKMSELTDLHEEMKQGIEEQSERTGALDLIGAFFSDTYNTLKLTLQSYTLFESMGEQALEDAPLGHNTAGLFKSALLGIVILVIILTIISLVIARKSGEV